MAGNNMNKSLDSGQQIEYTEECYPDPDKLVSVAPGMRRLARPRSLPHPTREPCKSGRRPDLIREIEERKSLSEWLRETWDE